ncbi:hypothetical protein RRG08_005312 [Elysia crispata]|uniref:Uncharacterized protein n=1 Tax=Elysia crispata TaxID=231223 RepID=A0AAE0YZL2_9GAST|nr:hypothetical protein RRG08_005312 [Elysia crispata]
MADSSAIEPAPDALWVAQRRVELTIRSGGNRSASTSQKCWHLGSQPTVTHVLSCHVLATCDTSVKPAINHRERETLNMLSGRWCVLHPAPDRVWSYSRSLQHTRAIAWP